MDIKKLRKSLPIGWDLTLVEDAKIIIKTLRRSYVFNYKMNDGFAYRWQGYVGRQRLLQLKDGEFSGVIIIIYNHEDEEERIRKAKGYE